MWRTGLRTGGFVNCGYTITGGVKPIGDRAGSMMVIGTVIVIGGGGGGVGVLKTGTTVLKTGTGPRQSSMVTPAALAAF